MPATGEMMRALVGAIQFLTVLPVWSQAVEPGRAALFFPLVGAGLGWFGAALLVILLRIFPTSLAALLVLAFWVAITGALHEDGLADVFDAFRAGRSRERILEILKDSRIGVFGALALVFSVFFRWQALANLSTNLTPALVASQTVPRAAMVVLGKLARPAGGGMGAAFCSAISVPVAFGAAVQGIAAALWCGPRAAAGMLLGSLAIVVGARAYFHRRLGGVTGDCLGATSQVVEIFVLLWLTCKSCIS